MNRTLTFTKFDKDQYGYDTDRVLYSYNYDIRTIQRQRRLEGDSRAIQQDKTLEIYTERTTNPPPDTGASVMIAETGKDTPTKHYVTRVNESFRTLGTSYTIVVKQGT